MPSASKNIYCANASSWPYTLSVNWSVSSQSISGNSTTISASGSLSASNVGWDSNYNSYLKLYWHDNRTNKDTHFATSAGFLSCGRGYGTRSVSGSITVTHNNDGSLSGYVRCEYVAGSTSGGWAPGTNSVSTGSSGLPSIPRASSFGTISGNQIGSNVTVNINRHSSAFTHTLWYTYGSSTWHQIGTGIATSHTFTLPMSVCNSFNNATNGTIRLMLRTYSGSTIIGSDVTTSFTANVPSWVGPDGNISVSKVDNGVPSSWGVYVKGYSKATVSVNGWGSYGSTIKSYSLSGGGLNSSASSATTSPLNTAGTVKFGCTITDSRWRKKYIETSIYVENYTKPSVSITAQRCLSDGTVSSSGSYLKCVVNYNYASVAGKNSIVSQSVSCNGASNTSFTSGGEIILPANCSVNSSYTVTASVTDGLGNSATATTTIPTDVRVINVKENKKGIAFGKFAQKDELVEFGWPFRGEWCGEPDERNNNTSPADYKHSMRFRGLKQGSAIGLGWINYVYLLGLKGWNDSSGGGAWEIAFGQNGRMYVRTTSNDNSWGPWNYLSFGYECHQVGPWWESTDTSKNINNLPANSTCFAYKGPHGTPTTGTAVSFSCDRNNRYQLQIQGSYHDNSLWYRNRNGDNETWNPWTKIPFDSQVPKVVHANGYWGIVSPDWGDGSYIRTPKGGLLPYASNTNGYGFVGTQAWPFEAVWTTAIGIKNSNGKVSTINYKAGASSQSLSVVNANGSYIDYYIQNKMIYIMAGDGVTPTFYVGHGYDGACMLGLSNRRWGQIYSTRASISTSDRNQKKDIFDISDPYIQMFKTLRPVSYKLKRKGSDRTHIGFISQEVKESMDKAGLTDMDFGGYCRDVKQEEGEDHKWHDILDENGNKQYTYSLRYEEFIALNTKMIQECMKTIEQQQKEIDELKQMVNALLQKEGAK